MFVMGKFSMRLFRLIFLAFLIFQLGCVGRNVQRPQPQLANSATVLNNANQAEQPIPSVMPVVRFFPWELWKTGQGPRGELIRNIQIITGDNFRSQGLIKKAAEQFFLASKQRLASYELDNAYLRLSSVELISGNPNQALLILSGYMQRKGLNVTQVDPYSGLIFAYSYGVAADYEQSMAWFSQVLRNTQGDSRLVPIVSRAVLSLLQTVMPSELERLKSQWLNDTQLGELVAQEVLRRENGGNVRVIEPGGFFWEGGTRPVTNKSVTQQSSAGVRIVGLLPLSGVYATLGNNVRHGLELAVGAEQNAGVDLTFVDTKEDPALTTAAIQRETATGRNVIFVGPILAPAANAAAETAKQLNAPVVALTKSENFATGASVMRLGPTPSSQIASLLDDVSTKLGLRKFGIIYPRNPQGEELLETFNRELARRRLPLFFSQAYESQDFSGFIELGQTLEQKDIDAIFVADDLNAAARLSLSLSERRRSTLKILGSARWDNQAELSRSAQALDGIIFASGMKRQDLNPILMNFYEAHRRAFGVDPDFMAAQGFDIGTLIAAASRQGKPVLEALRGLQSYEGITGKISSDASGNFLRKFRVVEFKNGELKELSSDQSVITQIGDQRLDARQY